MHQGVAGLITGGKSDPLLLVAEIWISFFSGTFSSVADTVVWQRTEAKAGVFAALKTSHSLVAVVTIGAVVTKVVLSTTLKPMIAERYVSVCEVYTVVKFTAKRLDRRNRFCGKNSCNRSLSNHINYNSNISKLTSY